MALGLEFDTTNIAVTWNNIFPRKLFKPLKIGMQAQKQGLSNNDSDSSEGNFTKFLVNTLLPAEYRTLKNDEGFTDIGKGTFSKYWTCAPEASNSKRYNATVTVIKNMQTSGNYKYETFELNKTLGNNIETLLSYLSENDLHEYTDYIQQIIDHLSEIPTLKKLEIEKIYALPEMDTLVKKLTPLVEIAATWPYWNSLTETSKILSILFFPAIQSNSQYKEKEWVSETQTKSKLLSADNLKKASNLYKEEKWDECCEVCNEIINSANADDLVRGEAYFRLASCYRVIKPDNKEDIKMLLQKSYGYGYTDAYKSLNELSDSVSEKDSLYNTPLHSISSSSYIVTNTASGNENECIAEFMKTIPDSMCEKDEQNNIIGHKNIVFAKSTEDLLKPLKPDKDMRYLLITDSQEKNFKDFLHVLNKIKDWKINSELNVSRWHKVAFYLRLNEDRYAALVDTALKRLNGISVKIYLIDDGKWPVQHLLTRHPLYTGLEKFADFTLDKVESKKIYINYVVISSENDDVTNRLIREAYWLGSFYYSNVIFTISVLSPKADKIDKRLRFECNGLYSKSEDLPDSNHVSKIVVNPPISLDSLEDPELFYQLDKKESENSNTISYYVINAGNDSASLNLAIKIREWTIRKKINSKTTPDKETLPTVAFLCKDPDIGHLSKQLIVQTIDHGNSWYNNYNIIPFGMVSDKYTFDEIDGGYLEKMSQCTHLQYCNIASSADENKISSALMDYFNSCYNRDSSMAVAMSLPYRLFQTKVDTAKSHIIPEKGWTILNLDNTSSSDTLMTETRKMAELFNLAKIDPDIKNKLVYYEHTRWLRWMITRQWVSASPEQVVAYMKAGNPKQQLFIGKMHGCMCSMDDLKTLADTMYKTATKKDYKRFTDGQMNVEIKLTGKDERKYNNHMGYIPKDFTAIDKKNIAVTDEILQTKWLTPRKDRSR